MVSFTTAYTALRLGRKICGYEVNTKAFNYHIEKLKKIEFGCDLKTLKKVTNIEPKNRGKKISPEDIKNICKDYQELLDKKVKKCDINKILQERYQRGPFSIKNILDKNT